MADENASVETQPAPIPPWPRVWPAVLITLLLWGVILVPPALFPESPKAFLPLFLGLILNYLLLLGWWVFFSRTPLVHRLVGLLVTVGGLIAGSMFAYHPSLAPPPPAPPMPIMFFLAPWMVTALTASLLVTRPLGWSRAKWAVLAVACVCVITPCFLRYDGVNSSFDSKFSARWQASDEERLVASLGETTPTAIPLADADGESPAATPISPNDWPGFRGPERNGHTANGQLAGEWSGAAPIEIWRRPVGPGWGSFCLVGGRLFTQEQRGVEECVVAYAADDGEQLWSTAVEARFSESIAGPGPRATPTYFEGDLYTLGAAGDLQRLDAATGAQRWRRNVLDDLKMQTPPEWGIASSPLLRALEDGRTFAFVYACDFKQGVPGSGKLAAYDAANGELAWSADTGYHSYSSPHLAELSGVTQILLSTSRGLDAYAPTTGDRLWTFEWEIGPFARSTQPVLVDGETVVLSAGYDSGTMPIRIANNAGEWQVDELWDKPSQQLVPYFNDMVLHNGHLFGIHKKFLVCVSLETGKPTWPRKVKRKTKVGNGQLVLDAESGRLLVTTEDTGEVLLVEANPDTFNELARFEVLKPERNWNHPIVAGGRLYVRHGSEAACYQLPASATPGLDVDE